MRMGAIRLAPTAAPKVEQQDEPMCEDKQQADAMAGELKALNDSRKALTIKETQKACEMLEAAEKIDDVVVVYLPDCHESLAGIIAGKLREKYTGTLYHLSNFSIKLTLFDSKQTITRQQRGRAERT